METASQLTMHAALGTEGWELLRVADDRGANRCTAACLDARQELRTAILGALAEGQGTRVVAQAFGVSREVVRALRRQALESGELDHHKQRIGLDALALSRECIDRIRDEIDEMPRQSLPIIAGVMIDKAQILTGGATQRIEHTQAPSHADINDWIDSLPRAEPVSSGGNLEAKGLELPAAAPADPVDQDAAGLESDPARDESSPVSEVPSEVAPGEWAEYGQKQAQKGGAA